MARMTDGELLGLIANGRAFSPAERGQAAAEIGDRLIQRREIGAELLKEVTLSRDSLYDSVTNIRGEYDSDDDRQAVEELDELINRARAILLPDTAPPGPPDPPGGKPPPMKVA